MRKVCEFGCGIVAEWFFEGIFNVPDLDLAETGEVAELIRCDFGYVGKVLNLISTRRNEYDSEIRTPKVERSVSTSVLLTLGMLVKVLWRIEL